jgi:peptidylprolyl isomerase
MMLLRVPWVLIALVAGLAITGCGGDSSSGGGKESTAAAPGPEIATHSGAPPKTLVVKELRAGHGAEAKGGDKVALLYVGRRWPGDGEDYSNAWTYNETPLFDLGGPPGSFQLMPGLDKGVRGMRVGGRREIIVPPKLIYFPGEDGFRGPLATLIFIVELVRVNS